MRYLIALVVLCSIAGADINAEIAATQAKLDSLLASRQAEGCARLSAWMQASIDSSLALHNWGLRAYPDARDSVWIELELPLIGASADKKMVVLGAIQEFITAGAQAISTSRIRDRRDRAWKGKERLRLLVEASQ